ncbi:MAG: polyphosphate kinase 1, partial [Chitinophagaceae bacterium]|nr:polyphosphate kinase 1 [Chitinophagaceae bacterium]
MKKVKQAIVRDLSWLSFNERVLQEAKDPTVPVYERLRFLGIFSNNLDEFFRVRVATLNKMAKLGKAAKVHLEN